MIGVTTEIFLSRYLIKQVDNQVRPARSGPGNGPGPPTYQIVSSAMSIDLTCRGQCSQGPDSQPGQPVRGRRQNGEVVSLRHRDPVVRNPWLHRQLPASRRRQTLLALPTDGRPHTVTIDGVGDYRAAATALGDGTILINGQPLAGVQASLVQLGIIMGIVTGIALLVGAFRGLLDRPTVAAAAGPGGRRPRARSAPCRWTAARSTSASGSRSEDTDTRTEVGQVGAALNQMLGHVSDALVARQASETRVRQFVADASHELRTPLAAIRGYAELARREEDDTEARRARACAGWSPSRTG